jgi:hypothetical protein
MDVSKFTNEQIASFFLQYGKTVKHYFPYSEHAKNFATIEKDVEVVRLTNFTDEDKKVMIEVIRSLPYFVQKEGKIYLIESDYNANESTESID